MKQFLSALVSFPRVERMGIALVILLLAVWLTQSMWVPSQKIPMEEQAKMNASYLAWLAKERVNGSNRSDSWGESSSGSMVETELFAFDPNTLDSEGFIRLGMPARAVKGLMKWRKHKHFYRPEDLKPLYNLPEETYARLAPYIRIADHAGSQYGNSSYANSFPAIPDIIDLNTADSATLDRGVPGIGATLSHKIIQRRMALGGFIKHEQLLEIYKFPDTTFQKMKEKLRINPVVVKKMDLNIASLTQMSSHPYVGEKVAKNILLYREGIRQYENVEQLRQVPLMNEEIYRKIAPYFRVN